MHNDGTDPTLDYCRSHIEAFRLEIDRTAGSQRYLLRSILSIGSFLIVGLGASAVYLMGQSLSDLKSEVLALADTKVQAAIIEKASTTNKISEISRSLSQSLDDYKEHKQAIDALSGLAALDELGVNDPFGTYQKLSQLDDKEELLSDEERATAFALLQSALDAGTQGITEPNTIFNTSVVSARLNFNIEAVKLAVLAEYWQPITSHAAIRAEYSNLYGVSFEFDGKKIQKVNKPASQVRIEAWQQLKAWILEAPKHESEQIYSRAQNVAVRNRSSGYYREMIEVIEKSREINDSNITSYGLATLADLYTRDSAKDWEYNFWKAAEDALIKLGTESPLSSWYSHTARDIFLTAHRLNKAEDLVRLATSRGVPEQIWTEVLGQLGGAANQ